MELYIFLILVVQHLLNILLQQQTQTLNQEQLEVDDPRNKENWGVGGVAKELQSVLSGGLQDTASSIATFPERTADALSGEMQKEKKEQVIK